MVKKISYSLIIFLFLGLLLFSCKKNSNNEMLSNNINQQTEIKVDIEIEERPITFDRELDWFIGDYDCLLTTHASLEDKPIEWEDGFKYSGKLKIFKVENEYKAMIDFETDYGIEKYSGILLLKPSFYNSEELVPALEFNDKEGKSILGYSRLRIGFNEDNYLQKDEVVFIYDEIEVIQEYQRHEYVVGTIINDDEVRLRSHRSLNSDIILILNKGQFVRPYAKSDKKFEINGEEWYWYKIVTEDRKIGWVYGKYLNIVQ